MFAKFARKVVQNQRRGLATIAETRKKYYSNPAAGAENPTYLKEPGDKVYVTFGLTAVAVGVTCILTGLVNMSLGINKVKK